MYSSWCWCFFVVVLLVALVYTFRYIFCMVGSTKVRGDITRDGRIVMSYPPTNEKENNVYPSKQRFYSILEQRNSFLTKSSEQILHYAQNLFLHFSAFFLCFLKVSTCILVAVFPSYLPDGNEVNEWLNNILYRCEIVRVYVLQICSKNMLSIIRINVQHENDEFLWKVKHRLRQWQRHGVRMFECALWGRCSTQNLL